MPAVRVWLAIAILGWTTLTWAGRIRLLTDAEQTDPANLVRIGGSIAIGLLAAAVVLFLPGGGIERWVLTLFAGWSAAIWVRSLVTVWTSPNSLPFRLVHTVLAAGFFVLAAWAVRVGWFD